MAKKKNDEQNILTYPGVLFDTNDIDTFVLDEMMRKFQSAKRFSRERLFEGKKREDIIPVTKSLFLNNSRYMRDALLEAEANITSQKELQPTYVQDYKKAIQELEKEIEQLQSSKKKKKYKTDQIAKKQFRIKKLTKSMLFYQHHIDNNTVAKPVYGSKRLLNFLEKGKITKTAWRDARSNQLFSRGEANKKGNLNTRLTYIEENVFQLGVTNPFSSKKGDRLTFQVRFPKRFVTTLVNYLQSEKAYSVRIIRKEQFYSIKVSFEEPNETKADFSLGCAGLDINPDNISVTIVHSNGNYKTSKVFWMSELTTVSSDKRDWIVEQTVIEAMLWIKSFGINTLGIEALQFTKKHSRNTRYNRMIHNFSYRKIINAILSTCLKEQISIVEVEAYYSSLIGRVKYQKECGISVHQAAAFVLARRAMGLKEYLPKDILSVLFAKEAKKGQRLSGLHTHWEKVSNWYKKEKEKLYKGKIAYKHWFFDDFIDYFIKHEPNQKKKMNQSQDLFSELA